MRSEVHDRQHAFEDGLELIGIGDIADDELEALRQKLVPGGQVVMDDRFVTFPPQLARRVTSTSSDYKHCLSSLVHGCSILPEGLSSKRFLSLASG